MKTSMLEHPIVSPEEWVASRKELLKKEAENLCFLVGMS